MHSKNESLLKQWHSLITPSKSCEKKWILKAKGVVPLLTHTAEKM